MSREMQDSGIPWIGKVPKSWTIELIGNQVKSVDNPNINGEEDNALQFKMGTIISKSKGDSKYNPETLEGYNIVDKGVIMLNGLNLSFDFISQRVGLVKEKGVITSTYLAVKPTQSINSEYLTYLFKSYDNCKAFHGMGRGLRQTLSYGELRKHLLIYPILEEQQKIAEFLDKKCGEVDEMIALQEQIIEELKAYKQSVITEAVTKGLNPTVPMKDSGIDWIGEIPEHWEVKRLKQVLSSPLQYGANESGISYQENLPRYVRITDILDNSLRDNIEKQSLTEQQADGYILQQNDILFARSGGTVGKSFIFNNKYGRCAFAGYLIKARVNELMEAKFVYYFTQTTCYDEWKKQIFIQSTIQNIGADRYSQLQLAIPTISEQQSIANYLDKKCGEIDELISIKQQKIESLKEYKKSIIYEYVTGKKEVV